MHLNAISEFKMTETKQTPVKPYNISQILSIELEYDYNLIFLITFLISCTTACSVAFDNQKVALVLHIESYVAETDKIFNSQNPST